MNCGNALPDWNEIVASANAKVKAERIKQLCDELDERIIELADLTGKGIVGIIELLEKAHHPRLIIETVEKN